MYSDLAVSQSSKLETTSSYSIRRMKLKSKIILHLNHPCRHPLQTLFGTHDKWWNFVCIFKTEGLYHYTVNYILFRIIRSIGNVSLSNKSISLHGQVVGRGWSSSSLELLHASAFNYSDTGCLWSFLRTDQVFRSPNLYSSSCCDKVVFS